MTPSIATLISAGYLGDSDCWHSRGDSDKYPLDGGASGDRCSIDNGSAVVGAGVAQSFAVEWCVKANVVVHKLGGCY